jgi:hypothetical protein
LAEEKLEKKYQRGDQRIIFENFPQTLKGPNEKFSNSIFGLKKAGDSSLKLELSHSNWRVKNYWGRIYYENI